MLVGASWLWQQPWCCAMIVIIHYVFCWDHCPNLVYNLCFLNLRLLPKVVERLDVFLKQKTETMFPKLSHAFFVISFLKGKD